MRLINYSLTKAKAVLYQLSNRHLECFAEWERCLSACKSASWFYENVHPFIPRLRFPEAMLVWLCLGLAPSGYIKLLFITVMKYVKETTQRSHFGFRFQRVQAIVTWCRAFGKNFTATGACGRVGLPRHSLQKSERETEKPGIYPQVLAPCAQFPRTWSYSLKFPELPKQHTNWAKSSTYDPVGGHFLFKSPDSGWNQLELN